MNATEELRRLLDERGVEWSSPSGVAHRFADSITFIGDVAVVSEIDGSDLLRINFDGTPAQAIDATLGSGTCHVKAAKKIEGVFGFSLSCGHSMVNLFDDHPDYCPWCGAKVVEL